MDRILWWRNTEKVLKAIEQRAFNSVFENERKKPIEEWWNKWEWLFKANTIILGIIYLTLKVYLFTL